jgi:Metallophosphoesterase, calcineurin superfamily
MREQNAMRRFLILGGINGSAEALTRLPAVVRDLRPEGLLFAGGVFPHDAVNIERFVSECECYTKEGALFLERFFSTLGSLRLFSALIPGVYDAPLDAFLSQGTAAELQYPNIHIVHVTPVKKGDVAVFGLGARIADRTSTKTGYYSPKLAEYYLRPLWTAKQPRKVLLLSDMPEGWHGDTANARLADALIETYHPTLCVLGRPGAEGRVERLSKTTIIHPGYFSEGCAAWLDWDQPADRQSKILQLWQPAPSR